MFNNWLTVVQGLIINRETKQVLMAHRPEGKKKPLLWEYPGGKVEAKETLPDALKREMKEELDIDVVVGDRVAKSVFLLKENVEIYLFAIDEWKGEPKPLVSKELRWVDPEDAVDWLPLSFAAFAAYREVVSYVKRLPDVRK